MIIIDTHNLLTQGQKNMLQGGASKSFAFGVYSSLDDILTKLNVPVLIEDGIPERIVPKQLNDLQGFWEKEYRIRENRQVLGDEESIRYNTDIWLKIQKIKDSIRQWMTMPYLGCYDPNKKEVLLFPKAMVQVAKGTTIDNFLISTLAHETMHAYFDRPGHDVFPYVPQIEEPLAEFGMLVYFDIVDKGLYNWALPYVKNQKTFYKYGADLMDDYSNKGNHSLYNYLVNYKINLGGYEYIDIPAAGGQIVLPPPITTVPPKKSGRKTNPSKASSGISNGVSTNHHFIKEYGNMNKWYSWKLPYNSGGNFMTIADFYDNFVEPLLPAHNDVIQWTKLLLDYVNEPDAVYAIRNYFQYLKVNNNPLDKDSVLAISNRISVGNNNPFSLRRGFLTEFDNDSHRFFYTDNFFTAYFMKMAYDGFVPAMTDLLREFLNRSFPARFGKFCVEEKAKAAYDITGTTAKDPGFKNRGYKIAHVVDSGQCYYANGRELNLSDFCNYAFPRGAYVDWQYNGSYYCRTIPYIGGLDYLKAHFLRFACPINYFLAPKANYLSNIYQTYGPKSVLMTNKPDIAELPELQRYIVGKFHTLYGQLYEDYLNVIMWRATPQDVRTELADIRKDMSRLGNIVIDLNVTNLTPRIVTKIGMSSANTSSNVSTSINRIKIAYDPKLVAMTSSEREKYLVDNVSNNYLGKNGLKRIDDINQIVNRLFPNKARLFDLVDYNDIIMVRDEVKKQDWNQTTGNGIPSAIVGNYCIAVTGKNK